MISILYEYHVCTNNHYNHTYPILYLYIVPSSEFSDSEFSAQRTYWTQKTSTREFHGYFKSYISHLPCTIKYNICLYRMAYRTDRILLGLRTGHYSKQLIIFKRAAPKYTNMFNHNNLCYIGLVFIL